MADVALPPAALAALLDALDEGVVLFDGTGACTASGARALTLADLSTAPTHRDELLARLREGLEPSAVTPDFSRPFGMIRRQGRPLGFRRVALPDGGEAVVLRDLSREEALGRAAGTDPLTGLCDRVRFAREVEREHTRAQRAWDPFTVVEIELDGMAEHERALGQEGCDALLRALAQHVAAGRREYDLAARTDAHELSLLLPRAGDEGASAIVPRLVSGVAARTWPEAQGRAVTVSAGAAVWTPPSAEGAAALLQRARAALLRARASGPSGVEVDTTQAAFGDGDLPA